MRGVDVSIFNENVDWQAVKAAGFDFAICRTGYGKSSFDENFQRNVEEAHKAGLICGAYHYSYALTPADAIQEAQFCKGIIERAGVLLELPVWFSMADGDTYKERHGFDFSRSNVTAICKAFIDAIKPLNCGLYAPLSWLESYIDWKSLGCEIWSAQWDAEDSFKGRMWQYTDALKIGGQTFNGNILYEAGEQAVLGQAETVQAQAPAPQQSTADLIHSILSNARPKEEKPQPAKPQQPSASPISSILSNFKPQANATQAAPAQTAAKPSTNDLISNILSNAKKKK